MIFIVSRLVQALKHNVQPYKNDINRDVFLSEIEIVNFQNKHNFILSHATFSPKIKFLKFWS